MKALAATVAMSLSVAGVASGACGLAEVCGEVTTNFTGVVESTALVPGTMRLSWMTWSEDESIAMYRLSRYNCGTPSGCTEWVASVNAIGTCGAVQPYGVLDLPPPGTTWTYRLEVVRRDGVQACSVEVVPE